MKSLDFLKLFVLVFLYLCGIPSIGIFLVWLSTFFIGVIKMILLGSGVLIALGWITFGIDLSGPPNYTEYLRERIMSWLF